jgi:2-polyprenyl-3-methyl-5-hydroxy-6-metoxy-1,4-benzoquinol methylase
MTDSKYIGRELDLFANVRNWKLYWAQHILPYIAGDVLEVGAGIGANTPFLYSAGQGRWVCLEPDPQLAAQITRNLNQISGHYTCETVCGTLPALDPGRQFDTIIYIDVLEHIENDREELNRAAAHLRPGGHIIVLSPAHQWLFTPFDAAIGHYRRYNRSMVRSISPPTLQLDKLIYLDSAGLTASLANRLLLRQSMPSQAQLQFWDRRLIPLSRVFDKVFRYAIGKSILAIWRKPSGA